MEKTAGAFVDAQDALQIQYQVIHVSDVSENIAHKHLSGGEDKIPLELINLNGSPCFSQYPRFLHRAPAA